MSNDGKVLHVGGTGSGSKTLAPVGNLSRMAKVIPDETNTAIAYAEGVSRWDHIEKSTHMGDGSVSISEGIRSLIAERDVLRRGIQKFLSESSEIGGSIDFRILRSLPQAGGTYIVGTAPHPSFVGEPGEAATLKEGRWVPLPPLQELDPRPEMQPLAKLLEDLWEYTWGKDIPSPQTPEYREHHEAIQGILKRINLVSEELGRMRVRSAQA